MLVRRSAITMNKPLPRNPNLQNLMRNLIKLILVFGFVGCSSPNDKLYFKNEYHELVEFQDEKIDLTLIPLYRGGYEIHNFKDDLLCDSIGRYKSFKVDSDFFK